MIDKLESLTPHRQKFIRAVALSMQGPSRQSYSPFIVLLLVIMLLLDALIEW